MSFREFKDEHGVEWKAWDVKPKGIEQRTPTPPTAVPAQNPDRRHRLDSGEMRLRMRPGYEAGWLSFESDAEKRRLIPLPPNVDDASEDQLRAWLAAATPFPKRGSFIE